MARSFQELFEALPPDRQAKILKRTEEMLKEWENEGGAINLNNNLTKEEKLDIIKKEPERTQEEDDRDTGC